MSRPVTLADLERRLHDVAVQLQIEPSLAEHPGREVCWLGIARAQRNAVTNALTQIPVTFS